MKDKLDREDYMALVLMLLWTRHGGKQDFNSWLFAITSEAITAYINGEFQPLKNQLKPPSTPPVA